MDELFTRFDAVFFEKSRLSALMYIQKEGTASFNQLKSVLKLTDGALYTHMEKLLAAGYLDKKKEIAGMSPQTVYSLSEKGKGSLREYLNFMEHLLKSRLEEV